MLFDINRRYPRAYLHRHKLHPKTPPFTACGQSELFMLVNMVDKLVVGDQNATLPTTTVTNPHGGTDYTFTMKRVYRKPPHITADNFFSSGPIMDWLGGKGYGMTATCARNRIPTEIKPYTSQVRRSNLRVLIFSQNFPELLRTSAEPSETYMSSKYTNYGIKIYLLHLVISIVYKAIYGILNYYIAFHRSCSMY